MLEAIDDDDDKDVNLEVENKIPTETTDNLIQRLNITLAVVIALRTHTQCH